MSEGENTSLKERLQVAERGAIVGAREICRMQRLLDDQEAEIERLRGELSLAEEGLANYEQSLQDLRQAYEYQKGNAERLKQRCWALALLLYPNGAPREAVPGDFGLHPKAPHDPGTSA